MVHLHPVFEGTWLVLFQSSWNTKPITFSVRRLSHIPSLICVITVTLDHVEITALWEPFYHFQNFLFFLKTFLNYFGCVFGVVLLLSKFILCWPQMHSMVLHDERVSTLIFSIENTNNPDQICNSIYRKKALNVQGTTSMLYCSLD